MITVEVKGLRELGEALTSFGSKLGGKYLARATYYAAKEIKEDAIRRAPVRTGTMRDHIAVFKHKIDEIHSKAYSVDVRPIKLTRKQKRVLSILKKHEGHRIKIEGDPFYWRFIEFGTSHIKAEPFLRPAFESEKHEAIVKFKEELADGVEKLKDGRG